jgi:hypothetical protein
MNAQFLASIQQAFEAGDDKGSIEFIYTPVPGIVYHQR